MKILRILERVDGIIFEQPVYVAQYDPTYHLPNSEYEGGKLVITLEPREAMQFPDAAAALEKWRESAGCSCHGVRGDGKPNRPLTAYTVEVEDV